MNDFENVFWLGGSPCAGKSSVSEILAGRFGLHVYHVDEAFEAHVRRLDPALHPALTKWRASSWNQRWMRPTETLVQDVIACYQEHFTLILEDILSLPKNKTTLVEGTALLPSRVAGVLADRSRAIWVIPTAASLVRPSKLGVASLTGQHYPRPALMRHRPARPGCSLARPAGGDSKERDAEFARWVTAEVGKLGLGLLRVDGRRTLEETALTVASYFRLSTDVPRV